jgi:hypothetical protein
MNDWGDGRCQSGVLHIGVLYIAFILDKIIIVEKSLIISTQLFIILIFLTAFRHVNPPVHLKVLLCLIHRI